MEKVGQFAKRASDQRNAHDQSDITESPSRGGRPVIPFDPVCQKIAARSTLLALRIQATRKGKRKGLREFFRVCPIQRL